MYRPHGSISTSLHQVGRPPESYSFSPCRRYSNIFTHMGIVHTRVTNRNAPLRIQSSWKSSPENGRVVSLRPLAHEATFIAGILLLFLSSITTSGRQRVIKFIALAVFVHSIAEDSTGGYTNPLTT